MICGVCNMWSTFVLVFVGNFSLTLCLVRDFIHTCIGFYCLRYLLVASRVTRFLLSTCIAGQPGALARLMLLLVLWSGQAYQYKPS